MPCFFYLGSPKFVKFVFLFFLFYVFLFIVTVIVRKLYSFIRFF